MKQGTIQNAAKAYQNLLNICFHFIAQKKDGKRLDLYLNFQLEEFTHTIGLDHLSTVKKFTKNEAKRKNILFNKILNGMFTEKDFNSVDNTTLVNSLSDNINPATGKKYTIDDRINLAVLIDKLILVKDKAQIYENWYSKTSNIRADYALVIPSPNNFGENIYFFAYKSKNTAKINNEIIIKANIYSFFADSLSLTRGKSKPYTVIIEELIDKKNLQKAPTIVFQSQKYSLQQPTKTKILKIEIPQIPQTVIKNDGSIAITSRPKEIVIFSPSPIKDLFNKLKHSLQKFIKEIKSIFQASLEKSNPKKSANKKTVSTPKKKLQSAKLQQEKKTKEIQPVTVAEEKPRMTMSRNQTKAVAQKIAAKPKEHDKSQDRSKGKNEPER